MLVLNIVGPDEDRKLFDTLIVFLKELIEKNNFEQRQRMTSEEWSITQHAKF